MFLKEKGSIPNAHLAEATDLYRAALGTKSIKLPKPDGRNDAGKGKSSHGSTKGHSKSQYVPKCYLYGK